MTQTTKTQETSRLLPELESHLAPVFAAATDGVYVWLDDENKACNERLARLFGLSVSQWRAKSDFLTSFVAPEDRARFSENYHRHVAALTHPVTFRFRALRGDGTVFEAETEMIPISYGGRAIAYHFVRAVHG